MADGTKIEWSDATWQVITGCSVVSPGCTNCYAMRLAGTRLKNHYTRKGLTQESKAGPVWTGEVRFNEPLLGQPFRWRRPRLIFVVAHGDLFHENVPDEWIDRVFAVMALCPQHVFQVLTKRPERMRAYFSGIDERKFRGTEWTTAWHRYEQVQKELRQIAVQQKQWNLLGKVKALPLPNVWLGVSAEDQERADERIPVLLDTPAALRWVSTEPLLGDLNLWPWLGRLDWVVAGGESGPGARPMHPDWARSLRDQCAAAGVAFHFKPHGDWCSVSMCEGEGPHHSFPDGSTVRRIGKKAAGRLLDGVEYNEFPEIAA